MNFKVMSILAMVALVFVFSASACIRHPAEEQVKTMGQPEGAASREALLQEFCDLQRFPEHLKALTADLFEKIKKFPEGRWLLIWPGNQIVKYEHWIAELKKFRKITEIEKIEDEDFAEKFGFTI